MKNIVVALCCMFLMACSSKYPNQDVTNQMFPQVTGESLEKEAKTLPDDYSGKPVLLLVGYVQDSQFDIDRWLIGLDMTQTRVAAVEVPTIQGMFPRMFSTMIDNGMRRGIPKELWGGVVTVYEDGATVQQFTGNESPNNARILLLDKTGKIVYFYDRGFSVDALNAVRETLATLN
ncbi:hypothetical protein [Thalassotalea agarivorans]|uniref:Lipoprotein n=1 Tax=Thalassotalea agarivorans TaxID=349064 RepID=A0A1I0HM40_THASX|nr:hypothetical protein [Thalassotalea agarivorans]SET85038.1 hypothetical protein SAMN05660429_02846 [Thalassotalea agarivorans]